MTNEEIVRHLEDHEHEIKSLKHRMLKQENTTQTLNDMNISISKMATSMEFMAKEQEKQGIRLETLEREPVDNYKTVKNTIISCVITGVIGTLIGAIISLVI